MTHGWWSPKAFQATGDYFVYSRQDGSNPVAVTQVTSGLDDPYKNGFGDGIYMGLLDKYVASVKGGRTWGMAYPKLAPSAGTGGQATVVGGETTPSISTKIDCDCPWSVVMRTGCQNPKHQ